MTTEFQSTATPNHALQRTAPRVTLAATGHPAACAHPAPAALPQPARRAPQSLSGDATRLPKTNAMKALIHSTPTLLAALFAAVLLAPLTGCQSTRTPKLNSAEERAQWPLTVDAAVTRLISELPPDRKQQIANYKKDDLIMEHFGLGLYIRNYYGLWRGNKALLRSTGRTHPDDASGVILDALWRRLRIQKSQ